MMERDGFEDPYPIPIMLSTVESHYGYHPDDTIGFTLVRLQRLFDWARYERFHEQYERHWLASLRLL